MLRLIGWRLIQLPFIILVIYTVTFALAWLVPGNPLEAQDGRRPEQAVVDAMMAQYKLDDPIGFYVDYLGKATGISWLLGDAPRPMPSRTAAPTARAPARVASAVVQRLHAS